MPTLLRRFFAFALIVVAGPAWADACGPEKLAIHGNVIWARKAGVGPLTVLFEAGFGNDSSVWADIEPRIRAAGVQTLIYDRAGMGQSAINTREPYSLDNDVDILRKVIMRCGVTGPMVFVGHSYGGAIGLALAHEDRNVRGLVLLDAVVPGVWSKAEVDGNLKGMRPQYDAIRKEAPGLAKVAIPWAEAMPETAAEVNGLRLSESLPIIDIKAEKGQTDPASAKGWYEAHVAFTAGHPARRFVLAAGSSHKVMADKPDLVVDEILKMLDQVGAATPR